MEMTPDKNAAIVGWTDEQWNQVLTTVATEAQKARLAASFLPVTGPLDPDTVAIPNLGLSQPVLPAGVAIGVAPAPNRLEVDSFPNLRIASLSVLVFLRAHEVADPNLTAALSMFRRAANVLARAEDFLVMNGNDVTAPLGTLADLVHVSVPRAQLWDGLLSTQSMVPVNPVKRKSVFNAVVDAIAQLEGNGYFGPFACVLGDVAFRTASSPKNAALVSVRDRLLPYVDGLFFRSSTILANNNAAAGIVIALGGSPVELVVAADVSVNFVQINTEPRWVFRVSERITLRIRDPQALVRLEPQEPGPAGVQPQDEEDQEAVVDQVEDNVVEEKPLGPQEVTTSG